MNTTDQIEHLMKNGVVSITIAISPKKTLYIQAAQVVPTGAGANHMQITHQADDADLPDLLNQISKQVEHANAIKTSNLVLMPKGNGR